ncbi:hypothetical protein [Pseudonocardia humida]|uniref:Uncharacterized protein n=1 Tax=Pseudonocardia humida TaxID=2800819 RepID=A0ABT1A5I9_9PSEU|nr:hypothetical protein [Pseudonocardia humida]MCO1658260.1 hypothetical protein [Pseudonocardia humida]
MAGQEQPLGWQLLIGLLLITVAAGGGAGYALLRGNPWYEGALIPGGSVTVVLLLSVIPRIVGLLRERKRSRDRVVAPADPPSRAGGEGAEDA